MLIIFICPSDLGIVVRLIVILVGETVTDAYADLSLSQFQSSSSTGGAVCSADGASCMENGNLYDV